MTSLDGQELTLALRDGGTAKIQLADNWSVLEMSRIDPSKITTGQFVGAGAARLPDGSLKAVQVIVFPESMRGNNEGHRAWDVVPQGTMTNAPVVATVTAAQGPELTLSTSGQSYRISVPPEAMVAMYEHGSRDQVKRGVPVAVVATRRPDGTFAAPRVVVGKNGNEPPA